MFVVISHLIDTLHPNKNDEYFIDILAFLLGRPGWPSLAGWPVVAGWHGLAVMAGPALFYYVDYPGTIREL